MRHRKKTNLKLMLYLREIDAEQRALQNELDKKQIVVNSLGEKFLLSTTQGNTIDNPNGQHKRYGWIVTGKYYRMYLYAPGDYNEETLKPHALPIKYYADLTDRDEANAKFLELKHLSETKSAKELKESNI